MTYLSLDVNQPIINRFPVCGLVKVSCSTFQTLKYIKMRYIPLGFLNIAENVLNIHDISVARR